MKIHAVLHVLGDQVTELNAGAPGRLIAQGQDPLEFAADATAAYDNGPPSDGEEGEENKQQWKDRHLQPSLCMYDC